MENTEHKIFFNFSYFALKLLGKGLYSNPWTAISELVANGLDANATKVKIFIDMSDKRHSVVEIFDNGTGMSYEDLANKYVLVGKNKREDTSLENDAKNLVMGRKGIGKLAALYLSHKYFLISKTNAECSAWCFDMSKEDESEIPSLDRVDETSVDICAISEWRACDTGTMIKLQDVDLSNIGIQSIEGLKARLSDYYLLDSIGGKIEIAVRYSKKDPIAFDEIKKCISFKNFYAVYDNTDLSIKDLMLPTVYISSPFPEVDQRKRETVVLGDRFEISGKQRFKKENGELTTHELPYKLSGWIGIHASIKKEDAQVNDPTFLKNKVYKSTQLRLYVRKKLAVEDFMTYIKNTQAFANYIEGEISFDILDENELEDIATSNRQGFTEDDERVALLIKLVKPIVNALIALRVKLGQDVNAEEKLLKAAEEEKRLTAEKERQKAEAEKAAAERKAKEEQDAREKAEVATKAAQKVAAQYREQNKVIFSTITEDQESFAEKSHLIKTNAVTIKNNVTTLARKVGIGNYRELGAIAMSSDRILSSLKYSALATFSIRDEFINEDLFLFCEQLLSNVMAKQYPNIEFSVEHSCESTMRFSPQNIAMIFDNLISNSQKSQSTTIHIAMTKEGSSSKIIFTDNGIGFGSEVDLDRIFEFGWSHTGGTGIGLYNVKRAVTKMKGIVLAERNTPNGAKIVIKI